MRISLLASATALLGLVSAAPMDVEPFELAVTQGNYRWRVTQWQACCSSTACTYKCYVQAPLYNVSGVVIPSFKAKCNGRATKHFVNCQVLSSSDPVALQASLVPLKQPGSGGNGIVSKTMGLSLSFEDKNGYVTKTEKAADDKLIPL